jgi:hypothetical protein
MQGLAASLRLGTELNLEKIKQGQNVQLEAKPVKVPGTRPKEVVVHAFAEMEPRVAKTPEMQYKSLFTLKICPDEDYEEENVSDMPNKRNRSLKLSSHDT